MHLCAEYKIAKRKRPSERAEFMYADKKETILHFVYTIREEYMKNSLSTFDTTPLSHVHGTRIHIRNTYIADPSLDPLPPPVTKKRAGWKHSGLFFFSRWFPCVVHIYTLFFLLLLLL